MHWAMKLKKNQNCPHTFCRSSAHGGNIAVKMSLRKCGGRYDVLGGNRSKPELSTSEICVKIIILLCASLTKWITHKSLEKLDLLQR